MCSYQKNLPRWKYQLMWLSVYQYDFKKDAIKPSWWVFFLKNSFLSKHVSFSSHVSIPQQNNITYSGSGSSWGFLPLVLCWSPFMVHVLLLYANPRPNFLLPAQPLLFFCPFPYLVSKKHLSLFSFHYTYRLCMSLWIDEPSHEEGYFTVVSRCSTGHARR